MFRLPRTSIALVAACLLLMPASALAGKRSKPEIKVAGSCAGDVVSGQVTVRAPAGTRFFLRLLKRQGPRARWTPTGRSARFRSHGGRRSYRFRFNVSAFDAYAYRLALDGLRHRTFSKPIAASSCAPGASVPEAPLALLLPLSLLGTASLLLLRRRRLS